MTDKPTPTDAATPECLTCSDHGAVGNILTAEPCPDCTRWNVQPAPATQQAREVRRAELVPGVMHCAKCKFQLNRVTLCVSDGNAYAGNNKTEPCPNGCGPLWPVTWEQEAKNCWKALEEMHERLMAAAAPQRSTTAQSADSVPAVSDLPPLPAPDLRDVGTKPQEIKEFLKGYATEYARTAIAARAPADSVQEDVVRMNWLDTDGGMCVFHIGKTWYTRPSYGLPHRKRTNLRAAIDAAMADAARAAQNDGEKP